MKRTFTFKNPPNADIKVELREWESGEISVSISDPEKIVGHISLNGDEVHYQSGFNA